MREEKFENRNAPKESCLKLKEAMRRIGGGGGGGGGGVGGCRG